MQEKCFQFQNNKCKSLIVYFLLKYFFHMQATLIYILSINLIIKDNAFSLFPLIHHVVGARNQMVEIQQTGSFLSQLLF